MSRIRFGKWFPYEKCCKVLPDEHCIEMGSDNDHASLVEFSPILTGWMSECNKYPAQPPK